MDIAYGIQRIQPYLQEFSNATALAAMDSSPSALVKFLLPRTPFLLKTALWHSLSLSETSSKWDLRTELTIKTLRDMLGPKGRTSTITQMQRLTTKDQGVKGKVWASKVKFDVPEEDDLRQAMFKAIDDMKEGQEQYTKPDAVPLEAEWHGYRPDVPDNAPEPEGLSEKEKYDNLMKEVKSKVTFLYFHGGAMYLLDPATYRHVTGRLARETGGKVLSVRYRLAPQNPFPAALLDALTAYLSLLYPPPGAPHDAVPANEIVFGGDSAGGTLCTALLQLLLQFHRSSPSGQTPKVRFHGTEVEVPLPAGLILVSPWLDITRALPSIESLAKYDYLPPPSQTAGMSYPPCPAWPTTPPRSELYCEGSALCHPLVSPLAAKDWSNSPPVFFSLGEEMLKDEDAVLAQRIHTQGGKVVWREFEAMPHVFAMMLDSLPASSLHFKEVSEFCLKVVEGGSGAIESSGQTIMAKSLERQSVDLGKLTELSDEQVDRLMREAKERLEKKVGGGTEAARPML